MLRIAARLQLLLRPAESRSDERVQHCSSRPCCSSTRSCRSCSLPPAILPIFTITILREVLIAKIVNDGFRSYGLHYAVSLTRSLRQHSGRDRHEIDSRSLNNKILFLPRIVRSRNLCECGHRAFVAETFFLVSKI